MSHEHDDTKTPLAATSEPPESQGPLGAQAFEDMWDLYPTSAQMLGESTRDQLAGELPVQTHIDIHVDDEVAVRIQASLADLGTQEIDLTAIESSRVITDAHDLMAMTPAGFEDSEDEDILDPFEVSGLFMIEELQAGEERTSVELDPLMDEASEGGTAALSMADFIEESDEPSQTSYGNVSVLGALESAIARAQLRRPWTSFLAEMRLEIQAEPNPKIRAVYMFLLVSLLELHGEAGEHAVANIEEALEYTDVSFRPILMRRVVAAWRAPTVEFMRQVEALRAFDDAHNVPDGDDRYVSLAVARLFEDLGQGPPQESLAKIVSDSKNMLAQTAQAILCHRRGDQVAASGYWRHVAPFAPERDRASMFALAAHTMRDHPQFCKRMLNRPSETSSRLLWLMVHHEACKQGLYVQEAQALGYLIGTLVTSPMAEIGEMLGGSYTRLAMILRALERAEIAQQGEVLEAEEAHLVMMRAVEQMALPLFQLRQLEFWCHQDGDWAKQASLLKHIAQVAQDDVVVSLAHERAAWLWLRFGEDREKWRAHMEQAVDAHQGCVPALIALGQASLMDQDWGGVIQTREGQDADASDPIDGAWRRADLLERVNASPREILALYRRARQKDPTSVHLFFSVERMLASLGQWRGLRTLFETTLQERPMLTQALEDSGICLSTQLLAVEAYLEDIEPPSIEVRTVDHERRSRAAGERLFDETLLWRQVEHDARGRRVQQALERIDEAVQEVDSAGDNAQTRALLWQAYLHGWVLKRPERSVPMLRKLFEQTPNAMLRRFAFHGLLRAQDVVWLAERFSLVDESAQALLASLDVTSTMDADALCLCFGAELLASSGDIQGATRKLNAVAHHTQDDALREALRARALSMALTARDWQAIQMLLSPEGNEHERHGTESVMLQLNVCRTRPLTLEQMDVRVNVLATSPVHALSALEMCLRNREWSGVVDIIEMAAISSPDRTGPYCAFLAMLAALVCEWGLKRPDMAYDYIKDWSQLAFEHGGEWEILMMLTSWYRVATRLGKHQEAQEVLAIVHDSFEGPVAALLQREAELKLHEASMAEVTEWYARHIQKVSGPQRQYMDVCSVLYPWLFGERDTHLVGRLANAVKNDDDCLQVLSFINILAHREADMSASMELHLSEMTQQRHVPSLASWARVRGLFHLVVTQQCLDEGLAQAMTERTEGSWLAPFLHLLQRATGTVEQHPEPSGQLGRVTMLERALVMGDLTVLMPLAQEGMPGAMFAMEQRAAFERQDWRASLNLELRYATLRHALANEPQESARKRFIAFLISSEPSIIASPWCPMRLIDHDMSRLGLTDSGLTLIKQFGQKCPPHGVGSEMRLIVARQLARVGREEEALPLVPPHPGQSLVDVAWFWLAYMIEPTLESPAVRDLLVSRWSARADSEGGAQAQYELACLFERIGDVEGALKTFNQVIKRAPTFAPAYIAATRMMIYAQQWNALAEVWRAQANALSSDGELASMHYRLGWLHENRLTDQPMALRHASDHYAQVLEHQPHHVWALSALARLSAWSGDSKRQVSCVTSLLATTPTRHIKALHHLELAQVHENTLNNLPNAYRHYMEASTLEPSLWDASLGMMRTQREAQTNEGGEVVAWIETHATMHPLKATLLSDLLFVLAPEYESAAQALMRINPTHLAWNLTRVMHSIEQGNVDERPLGVVLSQLDDKHIKTCLFMLRMSNGVRQDHLDNIELLSEIILEHPSSEGLYAGSIARARARRDLGALVALARLGAMRGSDDTARAAHWTRAAILLRWEGDAQQALDVCTRLLERVPTFLPAIKLARMLSAELPNWVSLATWSAREAETSRNSDLATRARIQAGEVQRRYLGDVDAAVQHLSMVLRQQPAHEEAFQKLKALLQQVGDAQRLIGLCESHLPHVQDKNVRVSLLNEMSDVVMNNNLDPRQAIAYLSMSLQQEPRQLRRLRILAELHDSVHEYDKAIGCYKGAADLAKDAKVKARMWLHIAHIYERKIQHPKHAIKAYWLALECDADTTSAMQALIVLHEQQGDVLMAIRAMDMLAAKARTPDEIRSARIARLDLSVRGRAPVEAQARAARDVLLHHPEHPTAGVIYRERLGETGRANEVVALVRQTVMEAMTVHPQPPFRSLFDQARKLHLPDLAFNLCAAATWMQKADRVMTEYYEASPCRTRVPINPMPPELTAGVLPQDILVSFIEIVRRTSEGILASCDPVPYAQFTKRRLRMIQPVNAAVEDALVWPDLYSLTLKETYLTDKLPLGSGLVMQGRDVRMVLDQQWQNPALRTKLMVRLGTQMAACSMGIGLWSSLGRDAQYALFIRTMHSVVQNWGPTHSKVKFPTWFNLDRYDKWLRKEGEHIIAPYVHDLSGRLGPGALPAQFQSIELAMERLGCVVLPDPAEYLPHTVRYGVEQGSSHRPWAFIFSEPVAALRRAMGIAHQE